MNKSCLQLAGLLLGLVLSVPLAAQPASDPDTVILSDTLDYDDAQRQSIFKGNVILTRGNLVMHADHVVVTEQNDGSQHAVATTQSAQKVRLRQESPEKYELIKGEGQRGEYQSASEQLTLIGQATLTRSICGQVIDSISGDRIIYNKKTDTYQAVGGANTPSKRVRSVAKPRAAIERAIAECKQKSQAR